MYKSFYQFLGDGSRLVPFKINFNFIGEFAFTTLVALIILEQKIRKMEVKTTKIG